MVQTSDVAIVNFLAKRNFIFSFFRCLKRKREVFSFLVEGRGRRIQCVRVREGELCGDLSIRDSISVYRNVVSCL